MALSCTGILTHLAGTYLQPVEWEQTGEAGQRGRAEIQAGSRDCQKDGETAPLGSRHRERGICGPQKSRTIPHLYDPQCVNEETEVRQM